MTTLYISCPNLDTCDVEEPIEGYKYPHKWRCPSCKTLWELEYYDDPETGALQVGCARKINDNVYLLWVTKAERGTGVEDSYWDYSLQEEVYDRIQGVFSVREKVEAYQESLKDDPKVLKSFIVEMTLDQPF